MKILNTLNLGGVNASDNLKLDNFPEGKLCMGIRLRFSILCTMLAHTGNTAGLLAMLQHFTSILLTYGDGQNRIILPTVAGDEVRDHYRFVSQNEVQNGYVGTVYGAGAATAVIDLFIPFVLDRWEGRQRLPGTSQMRTMRLEILEGPNTAMGANITRAAGNITVDVVPVYIDGEDRWVPPLSMFRVNSPRLEAESPDGVVLGAWDTNQPFTGTLLTRYFNAIGAGLADENIYPALTNDEFNRQIDAGGSSIQDNVTLLFSQPRWQDLDILPGGRYLFRQNQQDLATVKLRGSYFPAMSENEAAEAARVGAKRLNTPVLATTMDAPSWAHASASAWSPVKLAPADTSDFVDRAGVIGHPTGQTGISVPPTVVNAVAAHARGAADKVTAGKRAERATKQVVRQIPGSVATSGKGQGSGRSEVHAKVGSIGS